MPVYIALGANLSSEDDAGTPMTPAQTFQAACEGLAVRGVVVEAISSLWQSPAWPPGSIQPDYINACARVKTDFDARQTLTVLHDVERAFGRTRSVKNAARPLDLDLLDYAGQVIDAGDIQIPHPRMLNRGFVLFPLSEVAPDWVDPIKKRAIADWTARLPLADVAPLNKIGRGQKSPLT